MPLKGSQRACQANFLFKTSDSDNWKDWCWSWNSNTLATWCEELTHWKRPWCWEGLGAWGEGDDRGWDDWMASSTWSTWVWVNSGRWWWTGKPGVLWFMGSQKVGHDWATELNWKQLNFSLCPGLLLFSDSLIFLHSLSLYLYVRQWYILYIWS